MGEGFLQKPLQPITPFGIGDPICTLSGGLTYVSGYKLLLEFEDGIQKLVDLGPHLEGEVFEPLKEISYFKTVSVNPDLDTIVWPNNADFSPDFLYAIGAVIKDRSLEK